MPSNYVAKLADASGFQETVDSVLEDHVFDALCSWQLVVFNHTRMGFSHIVFDFPVDVALLCLETTPFSVLFFWRAATLQIELHARDGRSPDLVTGLLPMHLGVVTKHLADDFVGLMTGLSDECNVFFREHDGMDG